MASQQFCGECGKPNREQARFCGYCGRPLQVAAQGSNSKVIFGGLFCAVLGLLIFLWEIRPFPSKVVQSTEGAEYFWLSFGFRRTYDVKMLVPLAGVVQGTMITREDGTITINGRTYHKSVTTFDGIPGAESAVSYMHLVPEGIYSRKSTDPAVAETLEIPLPPEVGRKWSYSRDDLTMEMQIAAVEDVDTAEKTYRKCLKVTGNGTKGIDQIKAVSSYAPQTGLVKGSIKRESGVLLEFKLRE